MIIECEICGAFARMEEPPMNNICPECTTYGSLFIQENPTEEQIEELARMDGE